MGSPSSDKTRITAAAEDLFVEWLTGHERGEERSIDALCEQHPSHAEVLRLMHRAWSEVGSKLAAGSTLLDDFVERFGTELQVRLDDSEPDGTGSGEALRLEDELRSRLQGTRYEPRAEIDQGGQGIVLRVHDRNLTRSLAMKVLRRPVESDSSSDRRTSKALGRFLEEAQVTAQLDHPGIPPVHELGIDSAGKVFFTMKFVKGRDLRSVFADVKEEADGWTVGRALEVLLKVCDAMSYAHAKGVLHRDLKPGNVMVGRYGEAYVMDWGLARVPGSTAEKDVRIRESDSSASLVTSARRPLVESGSDSPLVTVDGDVLGTPAYMSPEQARGQLGELGPATDIYSIGAMLYHLLVGHMPYAPDKSGLTSGEILTRVKEGPPAPVGEQGSNVPPELVAICEKAMAREACDRYRSAEALADDLRAFLEQRVVRAYEDGAGAVLRSWVRRNRGIASLIAVSVLLLILAGFGVGAMLDMRKAEHRRSTAREFSYAFNRLEPFAASAETLDRAPRHSVPALRAALGVWTDLRGAQDKFESMLERGTFFPPDERDFWATLKVELDGRVDALEGAAEWMQRAQRFVDVMEATASDPGELLRWVQVFERLRTDAAFAGVDLRRQFGLRPLGPDPIRGFERFEHLFSAAEERWTDASPAADADPTRGIELLLIPAQEAGQAPFFVGVHEVTAAQWARLDWTAEGRSRPATPRHPAVDLSWDRCARVVGRAGLDLPTVEQWAFVAEGDVEALAPQPAEAGFAVGGVSGRAYDAGTLPIVAVDGASMGAWGLRGLVGNVAEWCRSDGDSAGELRAIRGGPFGAAGLDGRARRDEGQAWIGLRVVRALDAD